MKCPNCQAEATDKGARIHYSCGSYSYADAGHKKVHYESDDCTHREAIKQAWRIINVLNMSEMDQGEAYPAATQWLHEWEHLRPI